MVTAKILVVEDERIVAKDIKASLQSLGYTVPALAASGEEAIKKVADVCPDLVLMDICLEGDMDGVEAAEQIYTRFNIPIIFLTAHSDGSTLQRAKAMGPFGYILKPFEEQDLFTTVETALHRYELEKKLKESQRWWATTLTSVGDAVITSDAFKTVTFMNPVACALTGWKQSDAIGKNATEVFNITHEPTSTPTANPITQALESGVVVSLLEQTILIAKNAAKIPIDGSAAPIKDDFGNIMGTVLVFRDITERKRSEAALSQANEKLKRWVNELKQRNREIALLGEMRDVLQACLTLEEAYSAIANLVQPLFPETNGGIFLINASKNLVEAVATWGVRPPNSQDLFTPNDCWALRRGRVHWMENTHSVLVCKHLHPNLSLAASVCVPMMAQGEAIGLLHLSSQKLGQLTQTKQQLASNVAEHIALSLANLKLRETLKNHSIRDPLTGLFNRRYMEESLERELIRCDRLQQPLSIIMIDVDHFKRFNDTFGHEAGDAVLRELGQFLQSNIRGSDIACRYGGEELMLILPEASLDASRKRAEQLRQGVKHLTVQHRYQPLGTIALSLGVACFPEHGCTKEAMIRAADAALYRAKQEGRDLVITAS